MSIGNFEPAGERASGQAAPAAALGDRVTKGQLLAVIWSKEVGEKKSDLVNALSKLVSWTRPSSRSLKRSARRSSPASRCARPSATRSKTSSKSIGVERTLRSWRLTEAEINVVRAEAEKIHRGDVASDMEVDRSWAEVEVRCPFDGIVLEKNIVAGDIVDTSLDLFKIADLSVLARDGQRLRRGPAGPRQSLQARGSAAGRSF